MSMTLRQASLQREALRWVGTPFAAHSRVMGGGVDCVNLAAALYLECGFLKEFNPPAYAMDGGTHNGKSQLIDWLISSRRFFLMAEKFDPNGGWKPDCGDLLCFRFGRSEHHAGVMLLDGKFIHALAGRCVQITSLQDPIFKRTLQAVYRPD